MTKGKAMSHENKQQMGAHATWERAVTEALAEDLKLSYSDASGLVEAQDFYLKQAWTRGLSPDEAVKHLTGKLDVDHHQPQPNHSVAGTGDAEITATLFSEPSGNVRGTVTAFVTIPRGRGKKLKNEEVRIAIATLFTDAPPSVTLSVPAGLGLDKIPLVADALTRFHAKVEEVDAPSN